MKVANTVSESLLLFFRLAKKLDIPQLPEMTFGHNRLEIRHSSGFSIDFNAVAALELVNNKQDLMKVAVAEEWSESRCSLVCF